MIINWRAVTLRALLFWGTVVIAGTAIVGTAAALALSSHLRDQLERSTKAILEEEHIADGIVAAVQRQVIDATRYLQAPDPIVLARFRDDGDQAADDLTRYLFRPLSVSERVQVARIKEQHQALEVTAGAAFSLGRTGDRAAAQRQAQLLFQRAATLQQSVDRFVDMRVADRERLGKRQSAILRQLYLLVVVIGALLALGTVLLLRAFQRRLIPRLNALRDASSAIAAGDLAARVSVVGADELATVGASFNRMAEALQVARMELDARNAELASTVERLRTTQTELIQNEKLSALGAMLAGMAHELNNPLASVLGNAELLSARLHEQPDAAMNALAEELADPIAHEALRARELIRSLLHMAHKSEMSLGPVDVKAALDIALRLRAYAFSQAGLQLDVHLEGELWAVADRQRLEQTFLNIINNAYDALVHGGGSLLRITGRREGELVLITVEDDGPGLSDPIRVFDPFYTTKPVGTGTGLGLTMVHRFLEEAGGSIEARNRPGGGASFRLRLRATAAPAEALPPATLDAEAAAPAARQAAPAPAEGPGTQVHAPRVLVVDDEEPIRRLHRRILSRLNAEVVVAASGTEARDILLRRDVDVVISDVKMPGEMDGVALYHWVCQQRAELTSRFLFVTGDTQDPVLDQLARDRPDRLLTKPFQIREYLERVEDVLRDAGPGRPRPGAP